jgi:glycerophosphoryl diester phosphodiesterase
MRSGIKLFLFMLIAGSASAQYTPKFDLQGHRGARGLQPENTIPAFLEALNNGVTTLELDVVITDDGQVLVSHEPYMSGEMCLKPDGTTIAPEEAMKYNIHKMTYAETQQFDCGIKPHPRFPSQQKFKATKPLLRDVIAAAEDHIKSYTSYEVDYNIEIKSVKGEEGKFQPSVQEFSELVHEVIDQYLPWDRVVIQSFDFRVLQYWHKKYPNVRLAALVENTNSAEANLKALGFTPSVYSPDFVLLKSQAAVTALKKKKIRVIPWTVNEPEDMKRMKAWGVDGIITDYPNRALELGMGLKRTNPLPPGVTPKM